MQLPAWDWNAAGGVATRSVTSLLEKHTKRGARYTMETSQDKSAGEREGGTSTLRASPTAYIYIYIIVTV